MVRAILDDATFGDEPLIVASNCSPVRRVAGGRVDADGYLCEAAGQRFHARYEARAERPKKGGKAEASESSDEDGEEIGKGNLKASGGVLKLSEMLKGVELYPLMGVAEGASQDELKKAYRQKALTSHPDKLQALNEEEAKKIQEGFVKIQEAYEILSDPQRRMLYDSSLPFDETIPKFRTEDGEDFFEVFGEVFKRNGRFATKRPVPDLGGPETPMAEVKKFYDFWFSFSSWRDPLMMAQADGEELHDLEDAECREEKRWMIRENARSGKKYKAAEKDRISVLANTAEKYDPRIIAEKEAKKAARAAEAARREEERNGAQRAKEAEEKKKRDREEAERAVEAEKKRKEKVVKDAQKAEVKKSRQRLRACYSDISESVMLDQLNEVCVQFEKEALDKLSDQVEAAFKKKKGGKDAAVKVIYTAIESLGLTPMPPKSKEEDNISTGSGSKSDEAPEDPVVKAERLKVEAEKARLNEIRRKELAAQRVIDEAVQAKEREAAAVAAAEDRKKREEKRKKDDAAAQAKAVQQEKKEREKAKKDEEKKAKAEQQELAVREKQREDAKKQAIEQAAKDASESQAQKLEREAERVSKMFDEDRSERLVVLEPLTEEDLRTQLQDACEEDVSLRAAIAALRDADIDEDQRKDCLMVLLMRVKPFWHIAIEPPAGVTLPSNTRNKVKKARARLQGVAQKWFGSLKESFGADATGQETSWQRGMVDGCFEWPVWTVEERNEELRTRAEEKPVAGADDSKKGKKAKETKKPEGPEDLDSLLTEFGVTIKSKKKKNKN